MTPNNKSAWHLVVLTNLISTRPQTMDATRRHRASACQHALLCSYGQVDLTHVIICKRRRWQFYCGKSLRRFCFRQTSTTTPSRKTMMCVHQLRQAYKTLRWRLRLQASERWGRKRVVRVRCRTLVKDVVRRARSMAGQSLEDSFFAWHKACMKNMVIFSTYLIQVFLVKSLTAGWQCVRCLFGKCFMCCVIRDGQNILHAIQCAYFFID